MSRHVPDVSIIISTHNRLWALPRAIESCRNNSCLVEIIIVDDGSTDGTWPWLEKQEDLICLKTDNWGPCWAENAGLALASGEFVRFLNSDDWLLPDANDRQLKIGRATYADVVVAGYVHFDESTGSMREIPLVHDDDFLVQQIEAESFYSAYLIRRAFVSNIPHRQEFPHHDSMFVIELALANPKLAVDDSFSVVYSDHTGDRLSRYVGFDAAIAAWRSVVMYKKTLTLLRQRGECTKRRKKAVLAALWIEGRRLAQWNMREANKLVAWIYQQDDEFKPLAGGLTSRQYRTIVFELLARIGWACRTLLHVLNLAGAGND
jgi:glycosyltransferase involved in cell wall biosynthesis